jgi:hypothetical protein
MVRSVALLVVIVALKRDQPGKEVLDIALYTGVGAFVDCHCSGGMRDIKMAYSAHNASLLHRLLDLLCYIDELRSCPALNVYIVDHLSSSSGLDL